MSASGTAAFINYGNGEQMTGVALPVITKLNISNKDLMTTSLDRNDFEFDKNKPIECGNNVSVHSVHITK